MEKKHLLLIIIANLIDIANYNIMFRIYSSLLIKEAYVENY